MMFDRIEKGLYWDRLWRLTDGCSPCSPGCERCWSAKEAGFRSYGARDMLRSDGVWSGQIRLRHDNLDLPIRIRKPQAWLVLNDLFHEDVDHRFIGKSFAVMVQADWHTFLVLTKRIKRAEEWCRAVMYYPRNDRSRRPIRGLPSNLWLGVSVCTPDELWKIEYLLRVPAAVRWISVEPILSAIDFSRWLPIASRGDRWEKVKSESAYGDFRPRISWMVLGGEAGPGARPMNTDWALSIKNQCVTANVPFFFKSWGSAFGKKYVGRLLDDREWNELPEVK